MVVVCVVWCLCCLDVSTTFCRPDRRTPGSVLWKHAAGRGAPLLHMLLFLVLILFMMFTCCVWMCIAVHMVRPPMQAHHHAQSSCMGCLHVTRMGSVPGICVSALCTCYFRALLFMVVWVRAHGPRAQFSIQCRFTSEWTGLLQLLGKIASWTCVLYGAQCCRAGSMCFAHVSRWSMPLLWWSLAADYLGECKRLNRTQCNIPSTRNHTHGHHAGVCIMCSLRVFADVYCVWHFRISRFAILVLNASWCHYSAKVISKHHVWLRAIMSKLAQADLTCSFYVCNVLVS